MAELLLLGDRLLEATLEVEALLLALQGLALLLAQALLQARHARGELLDLDLHHRQLTAQVGGDAGVLVEVAPELADRLRSVTELALTAARQLVRRPLQRLRLIALRGHLAQLVLQFDHLRRVVVAVDAGLELAQPMITRRVQALELRV